MSVAHDNQGWITFEGEPVTGRAPPTFALRSGKLTAARRGMVASVYGKFGAARKLSVAGESYFAASYRMPDNTLIKIVSINGMDHIHVWASDTEPTSGEGVTFWCQPWDDAWIDEPYAEVFTIPRWFDINGGAVEEDAPEDFLDELVRNEEYEPPATANYPGNLTWFAPPPHASAGIVVSWWGQMRRYSNTLLDQTIDVAGSWRRPPDIGASFLSTPDAAQFVGRTGGIAGAIGGQMFHVPGVVDLPPGITSTPTRTQVAGTDAIWVNGARIATPAGFPVSSACLGYRDGAGVVRATRYTNGNVRVIEQDPETEGVWNVLADLNILPAAVGLLPPRTTTNVSGVTAQTGAGWLTTTKLTHPFYWNADGTEALGLVLYTRGDEGILAASCAHVLLKIVVGVSSCTVEVVEQPRWHESDSLTATTTGPPSAPTSHISVATRASEYSAVVAADFRGNTPAILRTHLDRARERTENFTSSPTVTFTPHDLTDAHGDYTLVTEDRSGGTAKTISQSEDTTTWASLSNATISGTLETRSEDFSCAAATSSSYAEELAANPDYDPGTNTARSHMTVTTVDESSGTDSLSYDDSGALSVWGLAAGDLRGAFVLHGQLRADAAYDKSGTRSGSFSYPTGGGGTSSGSSTFSVSIDPNAGPVVRVQASGTTSTITHLVHQPQDIDRYGSGSQAWVDDAPTTSTSSGLYGAGPSFTDVETIASDPSFGTSSLTSGRTYNHTQNFENSTYPLGAPAHYIPAGPDPISEFIGGGSAAAGGYGNTVLVGSALTPDVRVQYTGAVFVAMVVPGALETPVTFEIDRWTVDGTEFTPAYPDQPDPENPGETMDFPHRGGFSILLDPIFTGPLPP
jgi:hypothetical protein